MLWAFFHITFKMGWLFGVCWSLRCAAALRAAADKLTPKNRPKRNRSNGKIKPPIPNERNKKNTQRQKGPPRKGVRADPLADRLFPRGGRAFVAGLRHVFIRRSAPFLSVLCITPKISLIFLKICEHMFDFFSLRVYNRHMHLKRGRYN